MSGTYLVQPFSLRNKTRDTTQIHLYKFFKSEQRVGKLHFISVYFIGRQVPRILSQGLFCDLELSAALSQSLSALQRDIVHRRFRAFDASGIPTPVRIRCQDLLPPSHLFVQHFKRFFLDSKRNLLPGWRLTTFAYLPFLSEFVFYLKGSNFKSPWNRISTSNSVDVDEPRTQTGSRSATQILFILFDRSHLSQFS